MSVGTLKIEIMRLSIYNTANGLTTTPTRIDLSFKEKVALVPESSNYLKSVDAFNEIRRNCDKTGQARKNYLKRKQKETLVYPGNEVKSLWDEKWSVFQKNQTEKNNTAIGEIKVFEDKKKFNFSEYAINSLNLWLHLYGLNDSVFDINGVEIEEVTVF